MNQEQNNFNPNNFNTQGNNGMSNNQPLPNNQNINTGYTQQTQMNNINIYQHSEQSQDTSDNNQTIDVQSNYQQSVNNKTPKKSKLGLIIGGISAVVVLGIGVLLFVFFGNDSMINNGTDVDNIDTIKNGTAKLVATSNNRISIVSDKYFSTEVSFGVYDILDTNGNKVLTSISSFSIFDDRYISFEDSGDKKIYDLKKKKIILEYDAFGSLYKDNVFYYEGCEDGQCFLRAYDLVNSKELWTYKTEVGDHLKSIVGNYIFMLAGNYHSMTEYAQNTDDIYASLILDLDGNVIVEGNTDECEYYNWEKYDLVHTFAMNDKYYLKVKFKKYIEVYDFNHNLVSSISLEPKGDITYHLTDIFDDGMFSVWQTGKGDDYKYVLYDVNKNVVLESKSLIKYASNIDGSIVSSDVLALEASSKYYLIKDNVVVETFDDYHNEDHYISNDNYLMRNENLYLIMEHNDNVNSIYTKEFINLKTLEKFDVPLENLSDNFDESPNGEYVILSTGNDFYVYDSKFNLKYESTNPLDPINDKYVLEYTLDDDNKMYIVNIENGKKNEIDVKGKYQYVLSSGGFVTSDGTNYYLYAFN